MPSTSELRKVFFCVAVRAQQDAFRHFLLDRGPAAIRECSQVEIERLPGGIDVMPSQRSLVSVVAATRALSTGSEDKLDLSAQPASLLRRVGLVSDVGIHGLASIRTILALPANESLAADDAGEQCGVACVFDHMFGIII